VGRARGRAAGRQGRAQEGGWPSTRYITFSPVRGPGRGGSAGLTSRAYTYTEIDTTGQAEVAGRWEGRKEGGRWWRFHGLFRAHTSNHVRAFAGLSTYFRASAGDFDEWTGETRWRREKRKKLGWEREPRQKCRGRRPRLRSTSKGSPRGERANGLAESLDVLSEVFDIRKIIWRGRHATLEEER
jgi:hypothetical protein